MSQIDVAKFPFFMDQMIAGLSTILKQSISWLEEVPDASTIVFALVSIATMLPLVTESSFEVACILLNSESITKEKYGECVDLLLSYPTSAASFTSGSSSRVASGTFVNGDTQYISEILILGLKHF